VERESILEISRERFRLAEPDAILVWSHAERDCEKLIADVLEDPLSGLLDAVKRERVSTTGTHWIQETVTGASMMLDGLRRTLV
jgi:ABC-type Fe3+-hydroxamate transport system substrate-binding protein